MILSDDYLFQLKNHQLKNHVNKLIKIQKNFFGQDSLAKSLKRFKTSKNYQIIVNLCFNILRFVLYESNKYDHINLRGNYDVNEYFDCNSVSSHNSKSIPRFNIVQSNSAININNKKQYSPVKNNRKRGSVQNSAHKSPMKQNQNKQSLMINKYLSNILSEGEVIPSQRFSNSPIPEQSSDQVLNKSR